MQGDVEDSRDSDDQSVSTIRLSHSHSQPSQHFPIHATKDLTARSNKRIKNLRGSQAYNMTSTSNYINDSRGYKDKLYFIRDFCNQLKHFSQIHAKVQTGNIDPENLPEVPEDVYKFSIVNPTQCIKTYGGHEPRADFLSYVIDSQTAQAFKDNMQKQYDLNTDERKRHKMKKSKSVAELDSKLARQMLTLQKSNVHNARLMFRQHYKNYHEKTLFDLRYDDYWAKQHAPEA